MSSNTARLTLYFLISAFERDVRRSIDRYLSTEGPASGLLSAEMNKRLVERARGDGLSKDEEDDISSLLDYMDFGDLIQVVRRWLSAFPQSLQDQIKKLQHRIEELAIVRNRVMHSRPLEFDDLPKALDLFDELLADSSFWPELVNAAGDVTSRPELLYKINIPQPSYDHVSHNLPIPDFDDTGFIGRKEPLRQVLAAIRGVYPVITIVGEGGLGKTSLAIKAAYDLLESEDDLYDAIIFSSAKTSQLTPTEIKRIEGAVNSSLGLMGAAAAFLGSDSEEPLEDLIQLLTDFRILLIIDNLETVIDDNMRQLAQRMPHGSKLLITSRIGLGAYEYPVVLGALSSSEATQLLRAFSTVSGVSRLTQMPSERLQRYCKKMRNNPLHIKWFVSAVRVGKRPEEILADERLFLQFCLSNVYEQLSDSARKVIRTLLSVGGSNSTSEIAYLADLDELSTIRAIQELLTTNIFIASSHALGVTFQTKYELSQLSRSYLSRFYPVSKEEQGRLIAAKRQLVSAGERLVAGSKKNPLSPYVIHCRDRSDAVPAKHLSDSLAGIRSGRLDDAYEALARAKVLAPDFFEVHRVEGWINAHAGSVSEAQEAYERAIELSPESAHVRLFYGGFLLYSVQDTERALKQFEKAHQLLPNYPEPASELARCHLYLKEYDRALAVIDEIGPEDELNERQRRKVRDLKIQLYQRRAEDHVLALEPIEALKSLEALKDYCSKIDHLDRKMLQRIQATVQMKGMMSSRLDADKALITRLDEYAEWAERVLDRVASKASSGDDRRVEFLRAEKGGRFAFAKLPEGDEVFIHHSQLRDIRMDELLAGDSLVVNVVHDELNRLRAVNVRRA